MSRTLLVLSSLIRLSCFHSSLFCVRFLSLQRSNSLSARHFLSIQRSSFHFRVCIFFVFEPLIFDCYGSFFSSVYLILALHDITIKPSVQSTAKEFFSCWQKPKTTTEHTNGTDKCTKATQRENLKSILNNRTINYSILHLNGSLIQPRNIKLIKSNCYRFLTLHNRIHYTQAMFYNQNHDEISFRFLCRIRVGFQTEKKNCLIDKKQKGIRRCRLYTYISFVSSYFARFACLFDLGVFLCLWFWVIELFKP